jgi:hypothetical protein
MVAVYVIPGLGSVIRLSIDRLSDKTFHVRARLASMGLARLETRVQGPIPIQRSIKLFLFIQPCVPDVEIQFYYIARTRAATPVSQVRHVR